MSVTIRDNDGRAIMRSANLRCILAYSRGCTVERLDLFGPNKQGGGTLGVTWRDGSTCLADFACFTIMEQWVRSRKNFKGAEIKQAELVLKCSRCQRAMLGTTGYDGACACGGLIEKAS